MATTVSPTKEEANSDDESATGAHERRRRKRGRQAQIWAFFPRLIVEASGVHCCCDRLGADSVESTRVVSGVGRFDRVEAESVKK